MPTSEVKKNELEGPAARAAEIENGMRMRSGNTGPGGKNNSTQGTAVAYDDDGRIARTGTLWSASAHVITSVIGSGVLSLAWATAQMGWVAGPMVLLAFGGVTYYTSLMLANSYRAPDPISGKRNPTYMHAVKAFLGPRQMLACGSLQYVSLFGTCVGYLITASHSLVAMFQAECYHKRGHDAVCSSKLTYYMIGFGVAQIFLSQIPEFHQLWWLSIVAAVMSISYSGIGLGLGIAKTAANGHIKGSLTGVTVGVGPGEYTRAKKSYQVLNALGDMAFAYNFSTVLNNIQDTLKNPPAENKVMKKATLVSTLTTTLFYMSVGCAGYAAFGDAAPGDLMTDFGFYDPAWLVLTANLCIVIHLVGAYQVFAQPVFSFLEGYLVNREPTSRFVYSEYKVKIGANVVTLSTLRLTLRTTFVLLTTLLGLLVPFFNSITGLLGAVAFWPLSIYFPIEMYMKQSGLTRGSVKWWWLQSLSTVCLLVSAAATVGSVEGIVSSTRHYKPFQ